MLVIRLINFIFNPILTYYTLETQTSLGLDIDKKEMSVNHFFGLTSREKEEGNKREISLSFLF
jgi:hypothetical protein